MFGTFIPDQYPQFGHFSIMHRFCGVLNSFVKRTSNGKHVSSLPPKPLNSAAAVAQSKPSVTPKDQFVTAQRQDLPVSSKQGAGNKSEKDNSTVLDKSGSGPVVKEQSIDTHASKSKTQNGKAMPSNGGSLANMWDRASAKPKPPSATNSTAVASVAGMISQMLIFNFLWFIFLCITQHHLVLYIKLSTFPSMLL